MGCRSHPRRSCVSICVRHRYSVCVPRWNLMMEDVFPNLVYEAVSGCAGPIFECEIKFSFAFRKDLLSVLLNLIYFDTLMLKRLMIMSTMTISHLERYT